MLIQSELKAPKNQFNSFGKYNYRSCEDILEGLKPLLGKHKATLVIKDDIQQIGERFYVKATAILIDAEGDGTLIKAHAYAREEESKKGMDAAQVTGSVSSYARKYALNGLFCIDDTKDSDATNKHDKEETTTTGIDKNKVDSIRELAKVKGIKEEVICKVKKVSKFEELSLKDWTAAMEWLKTK